MHFNISQYMVPRHTLDICMKYSYVPQTEAPYKLDKSIPEIDWTEEPQRVKKTFYTLLKIFQFDITIQGDNRNAPLPVFGAKREPKSHRHGRSGLGYD